MRAGAAQALGPGIDGYEVVVVDDGSRDGTAAHLKAHAAAYPHVRLLEHGRNRGAAAARNTGVAAAAGEVIVFIDSDLVVCPAFLRAHAAGLAEARARDGDDRTFTYGRVVHTNDFADPAAASLRFNRFKAGIGQAHPADGKLRGHIMIPDVQGLEGLGVVRAAGIVAHCVAI